MLEDGRDESAFVLYTLNERSDDESSNKRREAALLVIFSSFIQSRYGSRSIFTGTI